MLESRSICRLLPKFSRDQQKGLLSIMIFAIWLKFLDMGMSTKVSTLSDSFMNPAKSWAEHYVNATLKGFMVTFMKLKGKIGNQVVWRAKSAPLGHLAVIPTDWVINRPNLHLECYLYCTLDVQEFGLPNIRYSFPN